MNKTDVEYYWCDSPVPPLFASLTSYPLVIWYPQGPVGQKVFEEPSSCRFPSRRKIITLNIFSERERFFLLFSWVYLFLFGSPFFSYPLFSLLFLFCEQSNWEPAWNERLNERKRKKTGLNINNIEFYFCFLIRGIFCEK